MISLLASLGLQSYTPAPGLQNIPNCFLKNHLKLLTSSSVVKPLLLKKIYVTIVSGICPSTFANAGNGSVSFGFESRQGTSGFVSSFRPFFPLICCLINND